MKQATILFSVLSLLTILTFDSYSNDKNIAHSFKISGSKKTTDFQGKKEVLYNEESPEHLFILDYDESGLLISKTSFRFKGEQFSLRNMNIYIKDKQLFRDGKHINFGPEKKVSSELLYKEGKAVNATTYYENGNKELHLEGDAETLNGEYKMWYPDGQMSFYGNYRNNLKHGDFESFSLDGKSMRKGTYEAGQLISGVSVVQDLIYLKPDVPAQFPGGDDTLHMYMNKKVAEMKSFKTLRDDEIIPIRLKLTVNYLGQINKMEIEGWYAKRELEIVDHIFKNFPDLNPALLEGAPVSSLLSMNLLLVKDGLERYYEHDLDRILMDSTIYEVEEDSIENSNFTLVEEMPEFSGGQMAMHKIIAQTIKYPVYAQEHGIQGKVFVRFVINENGSISNARIAKGVHPMLDAEAIRVVRSMPKWKPGRKEGKAVKVSYTVPINFVLR